MSLSIVGTADKAASFARLTDIPNSVTYSATGSPTLTAAQSGNVILFDSASTTVTLPAVQAGLMFTFVSTITANTSQKVITAGGALIYGGLYIGTVTTTNFFAANGTSHIAVIMNGTSQGGVKGSYFTLVCDGTAWYIVSGMLNGTATAGATPFSAS